MVPRRVGAWWNAHVSNSVGNAWFCFHEGHRYRRDSDGYVAVLRYGVLLMVKELL